MQISFVLAIIVTSGFQPVKSDISVFTHELTLELYEIQQFYIQVTDFYKSNVTLNFVSQDEHLLNLVPSSILLNPRNKIYEVSVEAKDVGHTELHAFSSDVDTKVDDVYCIVTIYRNSLLNSISAIIGWIYVVAGSISFYPQIYRNYHRKSVVGLSFDYLSLNLLGFTLYSVYNLGLYSVPEVQEEYLKSYPQGVSPVGANDVFVAVHAFMATLVTIIQCFLYERGDQRLSTAVRSILTIFGVIISSIFLLSIIKAMKWLIFLYICSYIKLLITVIKYAPQAYINYKRKSTVGYSLGTVFCDFTGSLFSVLQMIVNCYNYDDWISIFGNTAKLCLGSFSVAFDTLFIVQRYVLYNGSRSTYKL